MVWLGWGLFFTKALKPLAKSGSLQKARRLKRCSGAKAITPKDGWRVEAVEVFKRGCGELGVHSGAVERGSSPQRVAGALKLRWLMSAMMGHGSGLRRANVANLNGLKVGEGAVP